MTLNIQLANRSTHNQLEKKRRAHLRTCMESLRSSVPALNGNKATTLSLLEGARDYIEALKSTASKTVQTQEKLRKQRELLRKRISDLELQVNALGGQGYVPQKWASKDNEEENIEVDVVSSEDDCLSSFSGGSDGCAADNRI
ncbi:uncharacterized protein TRIADDRAFT_61425 [Trichoplax adhaerens]|uniref:BHLH domain-containing protein n=1 Tax=Trichoplax adhaerens TaxID=10228 RepID=B3SAY5_TRIAD|nr:hypothetical protein TRIADDRAFT_61425 [Trichoplax adhaerens]EDV20012.1 hypothetical protein TRIADDRAFT_61425 [Trichoplax adhaerens]|eukprot:XP_002117396.1 hypothetical protein TRIADDRAFT_61425 [Trichoplax adhaerens]